MTITTEKSKALDVLKAAFNKQYGEGAVRILKGDEASNMPRMSTGVASLDEAVGGGLPRGRIIELVGPESSGKTTVALHIIAECQASGGIAAFIDAEHAFDPTYATNLGVDLKELIFSQPDSAEQALDLVESLANSGIVDLVVVDSVAALVPKVELEGEMGDQQMGLQARLMSKACRKIAGPASKNSTTILMLNQYRSKVGFFMGSPDVAAGGMALRYFASVRMEIRKSGSIKDGDLVTANEATIKIIKNKTAPPYKVTEVQIEFGKGVNKMLDFVRLAVTKGIIDKSGSWFSYMDNKLGQGENNLVDKLTEDNKLYLEIKSKL